MTIPSHVTIVEVGPRDGLQNEKEMVPTAIKIEWIQQLIAAGLPVIEATSFVSPKWVPQLADGSDVLAAIAPYTMTRFPVLVPNSTGLEAAILAGAKEIAVFAAPSETFSQKNTHCSVKESLERIQSLMTIAHDHALRIRGYVSCVIACPYEGLMQPEAVAEMAHTLLQMGCEEISLGDTIGMGTIPSVRRLLDATLKYIPATQLAVHFHDTYGQALVNIYEALHYGISIIDSSTSGLGGCPYAKGASGNVATEDVIYMLDGLGIKTGVNLEKLIEAGRFISQQLHRASQSKVTLAMSSGD